MSAVDASARRIATPAYMPLAPKGAGDGSWSPVQQAPAPSPVPNPDPAPVPGPPGPPPWTPNVPGQGSELPPGPPPNVPPPNPGQPGQPGGPGTPPVPPTFPPTEPPPGPGKPPTDPGPVDPPTDPGPTDPPPPKDDGGFNWKPWAIGAVAVGAVGAGVAGYLAIRNGVRNVHALNATAAAFESGAMHQGGLQAIQDAGLGARFADGISTGEKLMVATPIVNRFGTGGRLTAVARGHLDHAELLAASTALRRTAGDSVSIFEPMRRHVLGELEGGRSLPSVLDDLDRSAAGAKPVFDNPQLARYWDRTSIVERGARTHGMHVTSGVDVTRPALALRDGQLVETGRSVRLNQLVAGRGADLDAKGLADGIGTIQGVGVSRLNPEMQRAAIAASGVNPQLVDTLGLNGAFVSRWKDRLAPAVAAAG
jgi:hypothetical protein